MKSLKQFILESSNKKFVDVIIKNENNQVLVLRRANYMKNFRGMWGVVGGSIEPHELAEESAIREVYEETQIDSYDSIKELKIIKHEDGSTSNLFLMIIKNIRDIKISREHAQYKWISSIDEIKGKWMPNIKDEIQKILNNE